jgi:ubiquinone/menaquinone biosynthesis C-methylase UbiE
VEVGSWTEITVVYFRIDTGVVALAVGERCDHVVTVDVSELMFAMVEGKLEARGFQHVETVHDGFLSYDHPDGGADFAFSKDALHHLPDFWKVEALKNVGMTLEVGGAFRLRDFVFSFDPRDSREEIQSWIDEKRGSTRFSDEEIHQHFREEYSTYGFLLESMLEEVGFEILESNYEDDFYASYVCRWRGAPE